MCVYRMEFSVKQMIQENFRRESIERNNTDELRNRFSAYVKKAVRNTKGHYLDKRYSMERDETNYEEESAVPGQGIEDLLRERELLSDKIFHGVIESWFLLDEIEDYQLFQAITSLAEWQKDVIVLRIFYVKSFREIGLIVGMEEMKAENTYYNAVKKIRKILGGRKDGV